MALVWVILYCFFIPASAALSTVERPSSHPFAASFFWSFLLLTLLADLFFSVDIYFRIRRFATSLEHDTPQKITHNYLHKKGKKNNKKNEQANK